MTDATSSEQTIINQHAHHPPADDRVIAAHRIVRDTTTEVALVFDRLLPVCEEKQYALKAVREGMMWANAAVAIHGPKGQ